MKGLPFINLISHAHIDKHTQAHMYDWFTSGMARDGHRSLVGRGGRKGFVKDKGLAHNQNQNKK